ncbi:50S ribosomal protein L3 N(5)-glutamine methyltransferase, partial [Francisella tularensis subsp. holarctica]|nr:50S ribosomal protein L3 N(5)-glutamine methyltransferase [Francisella tularensis subsp. holarctica]
IDEVGNIQNALMEMSPDNPFTLLSFADGRDGVYILTYDEQVKYKDAYKKNLKK